MADFDQFTSADQPPQDEDPAAEFLKREQEELAGLEDDGFVLQTEVQPVSSEEKPTVTEDKAAEPSTPLVEAESSAEVCTEPASTEEKPISTDEVVKEATPTDETAPKTVAEDTTEPEQTKTEEAVKETVATDEPPKETVENEERAKEADVVNLVEADCQEPVDTDTTSSGSEEEKPSDSSKTQDAGIYENLDDMPVAGDAFTAAPPPEFQTQPPVTDAEFDPFGAEQAGADLVDRDLVDGDYADFDYNSVTESDMYSAIKQEDVIREEPEKIKRWREEQNERLQKKDVESEEKKKEWRAAALKELEDWYKHRQEQLDKTKLSNREGEAEFVRERDENIPGHEWERISRLCDFNPKGSRTTKDISRMRSILLQLKQTPLVKSS